VKILKKFRGQNNMKNKFRLIAFDELGNEKWFDTVTFETLNDIKNMGSGRWSNIVRSGSIGLIDRDTYKVMWFPEDWFGKPIFRSDIDC